MHSAPDFGGFAQVQIASKIKNSLIYQKNRLFQTLLQLWRLICDLAKLVTVGDILNQDWLKSIQNLPKEKKAPVNVSRAYITILAGYVCVVRNGTALD